MCEHLTVLENELRDLGIKETLRGAVWSENCREWIYYDCYLDCPSLIKRLELPEFVTHHSNDDPRSGLEEGLFCTRCKDAIMGYHSKLDPGRSVKIIS